MTDIRMIIECFLLTILTINGGTVAAAEPTDTSDHYFGIQVVDSKTGRGVPMVRVKTVNEISHYTDSAGWVAFYEPGLMNREVFFHISSHGYQFPADGFGIQGVRLTTTAGTTSGVEIKRNNIAERLYRVTGQGIYRDTVVLGLQPPIVDPVLNGDVLGQDTVQASQFRERIYWFWGDTNRPSYPLGQFKVSGATSVLPRNGGLSAATGLDLEYFVDDTGFSRPMAPIQGPGAVWLHGLFVLHSNGRETMIAHYTRVRKLGEKLEHGLVTFNESTQTFDKLIRFDNDVPLYPRGQSLSYEHGVNDYVYFCSPFPSIRVRANLEAIQDPDMYESFTCLKQGTRYELTRPPIERDESGKLVVDRNAANAREEVAPPQLDVDESGTAIWSWKRNTGAIDSSLLQELIERKQLTPRDARLTLFDNINQRPVYLHAGSVHWNPYRRRWIMLAEQIGGESSFLGEIWYAESDSVEGPWKNARHVVTHDRYSFYNPTHHRFLDQQDGRVIFFEGTYADTFSNSSTPTPRYNYNQIMYRIDLANPLLNLPPDDQ